VSGDPDLDKALKEFLDLAGRERAEGHTPAALHSAITSVTNGLHAHVQDCEKRWQENAEHQRSMHRRLVSLEGEAQETPSGSELDPGTITGVHQLRDFAEAVKRAAVEGFVRQDTTPDKSVEKVVEDEVQAITEKKELQRLRQEEHERKAKEEASARDRRKAIMSVVVGAVGGAGTAGIVWLVHWLLTAR
jgi:aspartokinase